jgi:hypothetical protein
MCGLCVWVLWGGVASLPGCTFSVFSTVPSQLRNCTVYAVLVSLLFGVFELFLFVLLPVLPSSEPLPVSMLRQFAVKTISPIVPADML